MHLTILEAANKARTKGALQPPLRLEAKGFGPAAKEMGNESYEDLDEVVARFVEPLTARYKEVRTSHIVCVWGGGRWVRSRMRIWMRWSRTLWSR